jgi:hypothetical protein
LSQLRSFEGFKIGDLQQKNSFEFGHGGFIFERIEVLLQPLSRQTEARYHSLCGRDTIKKTLRRWMQGLNQSEAKPSN